MTVASSAHGLTHDDLRHLPPDGKRHELIHGEHHVSPAPGIRHQRIAFRLARILADHVGETASGEVFIAPVDVVLAPGDVLQPDLVCVSRERAEIVREDAVHGPPDLAVEIVSESSRRLDQVTKRRLYEHYGVGEYWIVDPVVETVTLYRATGAGAHERAAELAAEAEDRLASPLFPGLEIPLAEIFRD